MRVLIQRAKEGSVTVDGEIIGQISHGYVVLVGITHTDTQTEADWLANKLIGLRLFEDDDGKMNRSLMDVEGQLLLISQFTLYGDAKKGRRPSFTNAARPDHAEPLFNYFVDTCRESVSHVATGKFGADMKVALINDGPVTLMLERDATP